MEALDHVALPDVTLACRVAGTGPLVIAAHGFPDDPSTFDAQVDALVGRGFRVVTPYMRGYGPSVLSGSPRDLRNAFGPEALAEDLLGLARHYGGDAPVRLVGHDWGAVACFAAAALAPERVARLVTMAVPHAGAWALPPRLSQLRRSWYMAFFQLPRAPEAWLTRDRGAFIERLWRDWSPGYVPTEDEWRRVKAAVLASPPQVLGYYRHLRRLDAWLGRERTLLFKKVRVPAIHMHGTNDGCIGLACCEGAERFYERGYALHAIDDAGHFLTREQPKKVNGVLVDFLAERP